EREGERLAAIATSAAGEWRTQGGFEALRGNNAQWQRHVRAAFGPGPGPGPGSRPDGPFERPPPPREPGFGGPPPRDAPALLDAQKRPIVGDITEDMNPVLRPVTVDGATVGWVA